MGRDFRLLLGAHAISQIGTQVGHVALPLVAVLTLEATAFQVGVLAALQMAAFLVLGLPAGVWVDRLRKRPVLVITDVGRAVALLSIPIAAASGVLSLPQLYGCALVIGVGSLFFDVAHLSYIPVLVAKPDLPRASGFQDGVRHVCQLGGPGVGGALVQLLSAPFALIADAISFLLSGALIGMIKKTERSPEPAERHLRREIAEGLRFVLGHRFLRIVALSGALFMFANTAWTALQALFLVREIGVEPGVYGLLLSSGAAGALIGALLAARIMRRFGTGTALWLGAVTGLPAMLLIPLTGPGWRLIFYVAGFLMFGLAGGVINVAQFSYRTAICPEHLRGRMNATMRFMMWGTAPVGGLAGGVLGDALGIRPAVWVIAGLYVLAHLPVAVMPGIRRIP